MYGIKEKFSAAVTLLFKQKKIVQAEFAAACDISETSLSDYKTGRKEGREDVRRRIAAQLGCGYEDVLHLGERILNGEEGETLKLQARYMVSANAFEATNRRLLEAVAAAQTGGVNHGTVAGIVQAAPPVPSPGPVGDIARELCGLIAERLEGKDMDQQIAIRTRVKAALEGE